MRRSDRILAALVAGGLLLTGRAASRLSDRGLALLLRLIRSFVRRGDMRDDLDDAIAVVVAGAPATSALRRMLADSRFEELEDVVANALYFRSLERMPPDAVRRIGGRDHA